MYVLRKDLGCKNGNKIFILVADITVETFVSKYYVLSKLFF